MVGRRLFEFHARVGVLAVADGARRDLARLGEGRLLEHLPLASHVHVSLAARAYAMHQRRDRSLLRTDEAFPPCGLAVVAHHMDRRARHGEPRGWVGSPLHRTVERGAGVAALELEVVSPTRRAWAVVGEGENEHDFLMRILPGSHNF